MRGIAVIILHIAVAQVHATELAANPAMDNSADKLTDNTLFDRALKASHLHRAELDDTTLAKTHPAMSGSAALRSPLRAPLASPPSNPPGLRMMAAKAKQVAEASDGPRFDLLPSFYTEKREKSGYEKKQKVYTNARQRRMNRLVQDPDKPPPRGKSLDPMKVPNKPGWSTEGNTFVKRVEIVGIGYKARQDGENVILSVNFAHEVPAQPFKDTKLEVEKPGTIIKISGPNKRNVGTMAGRLRHVRPPEPYGGKGIRSQGEVIALKEGKSGKK